MTGGEDAVRVAPDARLELQGRLAEARRASVALSTASRGRHATTAWLRARIARASGDTAGAAALLEREMRALTTDGERQPSAFE